MAIQYYGRNRGQQLTSIVTSTGTNGTAMELAVDLTKSLTRKEVLLFIEDLETYLLNERTTPFAQ